jgi:glucose/arabinose dehydrogenase/mono/diheme cytochrome c family protein
VQRRPTYTVILLTALLGISPVLRAATVDNAQLQRGQQLYQQHCLICHQANGQGAPGVFPPLAKADYLMADKRRSIRILCEGIQQAITVNGQRYNNAMPPMPLNDQQAADVLTYVRNTWGNSGKAVTAEEVKEVRAKTKFPTYEALVAACNYPSLPPAPAGLALREVARLPDNPAQITGTADGSRLYSLSRNGDVWRVDTERGETRLILKGARYHGVTNGFVSCVGLELDREGRLYIAVNAKDETARPVQAVVTIYRTTDTFNGDPFAPRPWFTTNYPFGLGGFNHCVNHLGIGPDGMLYVNSGSRTDGNEASTDPAYSSEGEVPLSACMWRLDPRADRPQLEIYARGLRNAFGFAWDQEGRLVASDNGPNADAPEELNVIREGRHYGFPFQFADWTNKPYAHTPDAPEGLTFTHPIANLGPDGGFAGKPLYTFDPHSSPAGVVALGNDWPEGWRGTLLVARFGNLLKLSRDVGFDVLQVKLVPGAKGDAAECRSVLAPLGRPIDFHLAGKRLFIAEYSRSTNHLAGLPALPGRILELSVKP